MATPKEMQEKLLKNVVYQEECWILENFVRDKDGYPKIMFNKKLWKAHRLAYFLLIEPFDIKFCVLHRCDERRCINPKHLFLGTQRDNIKDMVKKERHFRGKKLSEKMALYTKRGEQSNLSKLTSKQVKTIRKIYPKVKSCKKVGLKFGVSAQTINNIIRRKSWSHI